MSTVSMDYRPSTIDCDWRVLLGGASSAQAQMALDERLAGESVPTVRVFTWNPPAISLGWKQPVPAWLDPAAWRDAGLEWVERPTGGGIAVHGSDVSISVIVPRTRRDSLETLMRTVCESAVTLCRELGVAAHAVLECSGRERIQYCLADTSPYAVMIGTRKVAGFALRRYPSAWLIQGSLLVQPIPTRLAEQMPAGVIARLSARACALSDATAESFSAADVAERWAGHMITQISQIDFADDIRHAM